MPIIDRNSRLKHNCWNCGKEGIIWVKSIKEWECTECNAKFNEVDYNESKKDSDS